MNILELHQSETVALNNLQLCVGDKYCHIFSPLQTLQRSLTSSPEEV